MFARKHLQNDKFSNVTGDIDLKDGLLLCHTCGREIIQGQGHANEIPSDDHFVCDKCNKQFPDIESL
jgi:DNA-directed RNA polymerase subunit RPC12/RpoP